MRPATPAITTASRSPRPRWQARMPAPAEIAPRQHGGQRSGNGAPWQRERGGSNINPSWASCRITACTPTAMRLGDDALRRQSMLRQHVRAAAGSDPGARAPECCAADRRCHRRHRAVAAPPGRAHRADARRRPPRRRHCRTDRRASPATVSNAGSASASRASISASRSPRSSSPASIAARSGSATSWRRCAPSTTSRHHCSRISASGGSDTTSRARASS